MARGKRVHVSRPPEDRPKPLTSLQTALPPCAGAALAWRQSHVRWRWHEATRAGIRGVTNVFAREGVDVCAPRALNFLVMAAERAGGVASENSLEDSRHVADDMRCERRQCP